MYVAHFTFASGSSRGFVSPFLVPQIGASATQVAENARGIDAARLIERAPAMFSRKDVGALVAAACEQKCRFRVIFSAAPALRPSLGNGERTPRRARRDDARPYLDRLVPHLVEDEARIGRVAKIVSSGNLIGPRHL
jgi:hypothetical protein